MDCGSWSVVGETEDGSKVVIPLSCRSWSCERCARTNKRRLLSRLDSVKATTLLTLTCNPARHATRDAAFVRTSLAVNQLFKRIRRKWPDATIEYFLVWERTKKGWPHAHLLLRAPFIPQGWLSHAWNELTFAPIVDIRALHSPADVVAYIAKYLSKDPQAPHGMKRYRASRRFFGDRVTNIPGRSNEVVYWRVVHDTAPAIARELVRGGWSAAQQPDGAFVILSPTQAAQAARVPSLTDYRLIGSLA